MHGSIFTNLGKAKHRFTSSQRSKIINAKFDENFSSTFQTCLTSHPSSRTRHDVVELRASRPFVSPPCVHWIAHLPSLLALLRGSPVCLGPKYPLAAAARTQTAATWLKGPLWSVVKWIRFRRKHMGSRRARAANYPPNQTFALTSWWESFSFVGVLLDWQGRWIFYCNHTQYPYAKVIFGEKTEDVHSRNSRGAQVAHSDLLSVIDSTMYTVPNSRNHILTKFGNAMCKTCTVRSTE
ncbi:hypothetical protein BDW02DRAFT_196716 [Decorospora gaudefroyi]|uniref:Uncharacterized protein n=1 Tax=Decorospora gaudefroyi TaxID=184978 RepID=A0A6A5KIK6_9PLEO|nr:hypothetical protein BDW02DRAFT_196716 [Decorospora gaudefroyi]